MKYNILIPSVEYQDFIMARLSDKIFHGIMLSPNIYPYQMVIELYDEGGIRIGWSTASCTDNERVDFADIENIIKDYMVEHQDEHILFDHDGTIHFSSLLSSMNFDTLERTYLKAKNKLDLQVERFPV